MRFVDQLLYMMPKLGEVAAAAAKSKHSSKLEAMLADELSAEFGDVKQAMEFLRDFERALARALSRSNVEKYG